MNQDQLNRLESDERSYKFLNDNSGLWNSNAPMTTAVRDLGLSIQNRRRLLTLEQTDSKGATAGKASTQKKAIDAVLAIANNANALALSNNDTNLYAQTNRSRTYLRQLPDEQGIAVLKQMLDVIAPHMTALVPYGVVAGDMTTARAAIQAAESMLTDPREVVDATKTARQGVPAEERAGRTSLKILDKLTQNFKARNPEFYRGFRNTRIKIDRRGGGGGNTPPQNP